MRKSTRGREAWKAREVSGQEKWNIGRREGTRLMERWGGMRTGDGHG